MNTEERLNLIETELRRLNGVIDDKQMQINTLNTEVERLKRAKEWHQDSGIK